jgi:hypothetical protein
MFIREMSVLSSHNFHCEVLNPLYWTKEIIVFCQFDIQIVNFLHQKLSESL